MRCDYSRLQFGQISGKLASRRTSGAPPVSKLENSIEQSVKPRESRRWHIFACLTILGLALTSNIENSAERAFTTENEIIPADFPVFYLGGGGKLLCKGAPRLSTTRPPTAARDTCSRIKTQAIPLPGHKSSEPTVFPKSSDLAIPFFPRYSWRLWR